MEVPVLVGRAAAAALVLGLAACSSHGGSTPVTQPSSGDPPTTGKLTGLVRMYGGPFNPKTGKMALNGSPGADWTVQVRSGSRTVAEDTSDRAGRFVFELAPGRYTLACAKEPTVTVTAGETVSAGCEIDVP
jgi:hypothetical protein